MTYLPGHAVVPCFICKTMINRRGKGGHGHRKYCSDECRREAHRRLRVTRDDIELCPRCRQHPRPLRPNGKFRGWCKPCEAKQKAEYLRTDAGRATMRRYYKKSVQDVRAPINCSTCHRQMPVGQGHRADRRSFCSATCRAEGKRRYWKHKSQQRREEASRV